MHLGAFKPFPLDWIKRQEDLCLGRKTRSKRFATPAKTFKVFAALLFCLFILRFMSDSTIRGSATWSGRETRQMLQRCHELSVRQVWLWDCECKTAIVCVGTNKIKLTLVAGRSAFIIYDYLYGPKASWIKSQTKSLLSLLLFTHREKKILCCGES